MALLGISYSKWGKLSVKHHSSATICAQYTLPQGWFFLSDSDLFSQKRQKNVSLQVRRFRRTRNWVQCWKLWFQREIDSPRWDRPLRFYCIWVSQGSVVFLFRFHQESLCDPVHSAADLRWFHHLVLISVWDSRDSEKYTTITATFLQGRCQVVLKDSSRNDDSGHVKIFLNSLLRVIMVVIWVMPVF